MMLLMMMTMCILVTGVAVGAEEASVPKAKLVLDKDYQEELLNAYAARSDTVVLTDPEGVIIYKRINGHTGIRPTDTSPCSMRYTGFALGIAEPFIDTNKMKRVYHKRPAEVAAVQPGLGAVMLLMQEGDQWEIVIPAAHTFAEGVPPPHGVPEGSAIRFEVKMVQVHPAPAWYHNCLSWVMANPLLVIAAFYLLKRVADSASGMTNLKEINLADVEQHTEKIKCYFDVAIGDPSNPSYTGTIVFDLFIHMYPKTVENFKQFCLKTGAGEGYKGSIFHRIIPGFMCQGGDFLKNNGTGCTSIYNEGSRASFDDEWEHGFISHRTPYMLSMANSGANSNGCQFFITTAACTHLDGKHVNFGKVVEGVEVVQKMEECGCSSGSPTDQVTIVACGELKALKAESLKKSK